MNEGWICPRCGTVNAPFVTQCTCTPNNIKESSNVTETSRISECLQGNHLFECIGSDTIGMKYKCKRCGAIEHKPYTTC